MKTLFINNWNNFNEEQDESFRFDLLTLSWSNEVKSLAIIILNIEIRIYF